MKRIKLKDLPNQLTQEIIDILVEMALEEPKLTFDWRDISNFLSENDYESLRKILDIVNERKKKSESNKSESYNRYNEVDPNEFFGNMGEPTSPEEYKNRFGVWPPGFDDKGNKT